MVVEPQNRMRESANAAGTLISMVVTTTITDTAAELRKKIRYCGEESNST